MRSLGIFVIGTLLYAMVALGQATSTVVEVSGVVTDPTNAVVAGANVTITETGTGSIRTTTTTAAGSYVFPNLPIGQYKLEIRAAGFKDYLQQGIILQVNTNPNINVQLQIGGSSQEVVVTANAGMVETSDTSVSQVIDQGRIVDLPLNGREATQLVVLAGAATATNSNPVNDLGGTGKQYYLNAVNISVAGGQANGTNYMLDGADHNDAFSNVNLPFPFPDALQEFSVQTSVLSAQYGLHPGAVVNAVTKSGTNAFHGGMFEFLRNGDLDATSFFAKTRDSLKRNQFGGVLGGPIRKNALFFFVGYQGTRIRTAPATSLSYVPTQAVLDGDFSQFESAACQSNGQPRTIIDPVTGAPFPNDYVSPTRYNSASLQLLNIVPVSTNPCGSIRYAIPTPEDEDQGIARFDWTGKSRNDFFSRYFITDYRGPTFGPASFNPKNGLANSAYGLFDRAQSLVLGDTYSLNSNTIMTGHVGFTRLAIGRVAVAGIGTVGAAGVQIYQPLANVIGVGVSNDFSLSSNLGNFNTTAYQFAYDMKLIRGKHQINLGVEMIHNQQNDLGGFDANGDFGFNGQFTKDPMIDYLLGLPDTFEQSGEERDNWRQTYWGGYVDDSYRALPNLTLRAGLRWEPYLPTEDEFHRGNHFDPQAFAAGTRSKIFPNAPPGLFFCGDKQTPCAYTNPRWLDFDPRVGLIWDPKGNGRQTVRASYGIFYDQPEDFYFDRFTDSPPWTASLTITDLSGGFTNPYAGYPGGSPFPIPFPPPHTASFPAYAQYVNMPLNVRATYMQQWNLALQQQVGANWVLSATYLGNKTTHLWSGTEENPAVFIPGQCGNAACSTTANTNQRRVLYLENPSAGSAFSTIGLLDDGAYANYNGLLLSANHRLDEHFSVLANYTWSHCISVADFESELIGPQYQNPSDPNADYGNCGFDIRQIFNLSFIAVTPRFSDHFLERAVGVWQLGGILTRETGLWFSPLTGTDRSLTGVGNDRPDMIGNPKLAHPSIHQWFNAGAFMPNALGTFGNAGRNSLEGPAQINLDLSLVRNIAILEHQTLQIRGEFFNSLNHPQLSDPQNTLTSSTFGQVTGTGSPRIIQLALKYSF